MKTILKITVLVCLTIPAFTQPDNRPSIEIVEIEGLFIEAKKEVLLENFEEALAVYQSIIKKDKTNAAAYYEIAKVYEKLNKPTDAKANAKDAFVNDNTNEWYGAYYADFLGEDGEWQQAADVYEAIISANPKQSEYYYERAYLLTKAKKFDKAIEVYNDLETKTGINERSSRHKHTIYNLMGKTTQAAEVLESLIMTFPTESQYYHILAQYYDAQGKAGKAKETYKRALKANPEDPVASIALAENMKAEGNEAQYLLGLKPLFNRDEVGIDIKVKELYPYINKLPNVKNGVPEALLELSKIMTETHPNDAKAFAIYADILYYTGNPTDALTQYNKTLELDNSVYSVWEQVLIVNETLGRFDDIIKTSENAMDYFPNQAFVFYMNGLGYNRKGEYEDAIDALEQAMMMSGRDEVMKAKVHSELGISYFGDKDYDSSNENFDAALALDGNSISVLNNYSYYLALQGKDLAKAEEYIKKANKLAANQPTVQDTYGFIFYKKKKYTEAEKWFKKALDNGGNMNFVILEHYGDVLYQLNRTDEAVTYWQKAKSLGSNSKILNKKISERKVFE
ncbi:MAG: tetratricopeptide repeat protein [Saprospiraceae bacterium]